jgi:glycine oxidase
LPDLRPKNSSERCDVVVIGAGVIGLAIAWRASQAGLRVRVLEREEPGSGASGVAAGMLAPVGEATWGEEGLLAAALASHALWDGFAEELAATGETGASLLKAGALHVALDSDEAAELRRRFELMETLGLEARWITGRECRSIEPGLGPSAYGGVLAPHEAGVDPIAVVDALSRACASEGAEVVTGAEVAGVVRDVDRVRGVVTKDGLRHEAEAVVLASGAWAGSAEWLPPEVRPPVRPIKGQILTLRGAQAQPVAERIIVTERVYLVPRADGRLVAGATVEEMGWDTRVTAGGVFELLREAYRALPDVAELELERAITGLRPGTPDNAPVVGPSGMDGLLFATGHFRNGILLAPLTAQAVVSMLEGGDAPDELAAADPARFAAVAG